MNYIKFKLLFMSCLLTCAIQANSGAKKITFNYENEELVNVINYIASEKNINVVLPMRPDQKITGKFSWALDKKISIDEAWDLLSTILDIAGYSIVPKAEYYEIVKTTKEVSREPVPFFVGTSLDELPPSDQRIRYIYYFSNIKLQAGDGRQNEINTVLQTLLPENSVFKIDVASNAVLLLAPSTDVYSVMQVIMQLDRPGFQEKLEIMPLRYANARIVSDLFNKKILQSTTDAKYHLGPKKTTEAQYFSKHLRIISNDRNNSIIMIGRSQAIERVKKFVDNYIDVKPDSGNSILHIYQLQYLDAPSFAEVLNNIVKSKQSGGAEQSTGGASKVTGPERFFENVVIAVDTPKSEGFEAPISAPESEKEKSAKLPPPKYYGGNNLIIAARGDDWKRIKKLIEDLDKPKPQVLIEVLIVDLTLNDNRALGNMFRNAAKLPMPGEFNIQSAQLQPGVIPDSFDNPETIGVIQTAAGAVKTAADEARLFTTDAQGKRSDASASTEGAQSVIKGFEAGSTAITLNDDDGKTWSIAQILNVIDNNKVLSHPHVISTHNQEARIEDKRIRLLEGASKVAGSAIERKQEAVPATLSVAFRPRISHGINQKQGTVNLQISVVIDEYRSATDNTRITRNVTTNATINSGQVLAIGGLLRTNETNSTSQTPLLSQIPIIGWLFKNRSKSRERTNLTVFISPTIIEPRLRGGIGEYTQDYLALQKSLAKEGNLFDSLKDPITRWFFKTDKSPTETFANEFMAHDEVHSNGKDKVPMPDGETLGKRKGRKSATSLEVAHTKSQSNKLKNLLEDIDNPFKETNQIATIHPRF